MRFAELLDDEESILFGSAIHFCNCRLRTGHNSYGRIRTQRYCVKLLCLV